MATFKFKDRHVYYDVVGQGEPLLLLNGIMMSTKSWEVFKEDFSKDFMFVRVDFLDQGQSDSLEEDYTQEVQVELLVALLDHLHLQKVNLVGISYGGEVALLFATKYQDKINRLILFNTVAHTDKDLRLLGYLWNDNAKARNYEEYYNLTIPTIYSNKFINGHTEWMKNRKELLLNGPFSNHVFLDRMIRLTNSSETYDVRDQLSKLKLPVLIVGATDDTLTPLSRQESLYQMIPNSRMVVLPDVGHASMYEVPELFVMIVVGYLKANKTIYVI